MFFWGLGTLLHAFGGRRIGAGSPSRGRADVALVLPEIECKHVNVWTIKPKNGKEAMKARA